MKFVLVLLGLLAFSLTTNATYAGSHDGGNRIGSSKHSEKPKTGETLPSSQTANSCGCSHEPG